jgi:CheY-like chemotaxis protein
MPAPLLLLVDDAPEIAFLVRRLTQKAGQELIARRDAPQALLWLETVRPDLAIVDIHLPGMSGLEFCSHLRRLRGREETPIALFTHPRQTDDVLAGLEAGADFLLSKDLLAQPDAWFPRLEQILNACRDRPKARPLEYVVSAPAKKLPNDGIPALNEALQHPALLQLGIPVVRLLLRRVVEQLARLMDLSDGPTAVTEPAFVSTWLLHDRLGLSAAAFPVSDRSRWVAACASLLAEQIALVWGNPAGETARAALTLANGSGG